MLNKYYRFAIENALSKALESGYKPDSQLRKKIVIYLDISRHFYIWRK